MLCFLVGADQYLWNLIEKGKKKKNQKQPPTPIPSSTNVAWSVQFRNDFDSCNYEIL